MDNYELIGELPTAPAIMCSADVKYFNDHGLALIQSADNIGKNIHVHVVNMTDDIIELLERTKKIIKTKLTYTYNKIDTTGWTQDQLSGYYQAHRFIIAPKLLESAKKLMIVDIDCMFNMTFVWPPKQCGFFLRNKPSLSKQVAAGVVYYDISGLNIAKTISDQLQQGSFAYYKDQITIATVVQTLDKSNIHVFDNKFMDWDFVPTSVMWTGKGKKKYDNMRYVTLKNNLNLQLNAKLMSI